MSLIAPLTPALRWRCRRGMLELDLLLERFLERGYAALDATGQAQFERLLGHPDPQLHDWLLGLDPPPATDPALAHVIQAVRDAT